MGEKKSVQYPFPSPGDWRDCSIYFLMLDRFNNPSAAPRSRWDGTYGFRQGGTFKGVQERIPYIADLGVKAIWLSPPLKNPGPPEWQYNYHGYAIQDFLSVDERFGSEEDLQNLVTTAHACGVYVILDMVLNHAGRVFDYLLGGVTRDSFCDPKVLYGPLGSEPDIRWLDAFGSPRAEWTNTIPPGPAPAPGDAVYPEELRNYLFFRRRGCKVTDTLGAQTFIPGDFDSMRQMVVEYDATVPGQEAIREKLGQHPVLNALIRCYSYLIARFDFDGFRMDTVKYVHPDMIQAFGNAIREYALSIGKTNFFTFGEVYDNEANIDKFVGRKGGNKGGVGIDAALDFPLFYKLPAVSKAFEGVEDIRTVFENRKAEQADLISSHGEAGAFFVTFLDNHDQHERIKDPKTPQDQVTLALAVMFGLQGIPCVYYGTEQGLDVTKSPDGTPQLGANESVREALWGKPGAFDQGHAMYRAIKALAELRNNCPPLRYGRLYFREISGNGVDFGHSAGVGGVIAYSRVLYESEVVVIANTNTELPFIGHVIVDLDLNRQASPFQVLYSNKGKQGQAPVTPGTCNFWDRNVLKGRGTAAKLSVELQPMEALILGDFS